MSLIIYIWKNIQIIRVLKILSKTETMYYQMSMRLKNVFIVNIYEHVCISVIFEVAKISFSLHGQLLKKNTLRAHVQWTISQLRVRSSGFSLILFPSYDTSLLSRNHKIQDSCTKMFFSASISWYHPKKSEYHRTDFMST